MTRVPHRWLRWSMLAGTLGLCAAPATATAGLTARTAALTQRLGLRIEAAADPIHGLTDAQLAGQRLVVGFAGRSAPKALLRRAERGELGGVIVFTRNLGSASEVRSMTSAFQRAAQRAPGGRKLLIMVDQEGGQVSRLSGPPRRSPAEVGATGSAAVAREEGRATARNLAGVGVNTNLAPVVDVARPGANMRKLGRAYGGATGRVSRLAGAFSAGLRAGGVLSCAKHFPGLGRATGDEDLHLNRIGASLNTLRAVDEPPFVNTRTQLVMVSTGIYPAIDSAPALFSRKITTGELREHLGFAGTSITDDLQVPVLARTGTPSALGLAAARAGNDLLLYAQSAGAGFSAARALQRGLHDGSLNRKEFSAAVRRVLDLRASLG